MVIFNISSRLYQPNPWNRNNKIWGTEGARANVWDQELRAEKNKYPTQSNFLFLAPYLFPIQNSRDLYVFTYFHCHYNHLT